MIQPFDDGKFNRRFEETFSPAIEAAGLIPYRVDKDPSASDLIEGIQSGIDRCLAILVDISTDNPNVWYELGYALARNKPFCLICSDERVGAFPFDVSKLKIIKYKTESASDFTTLGARITERLTTVASSAKQLETLSESIGSSAATSGSELEAHELNALLIIFEEHLDGPISNWMFVRNMQSAGYTKAAAALAIVTLLKRRYIKKLEQTDRDGDPYTSYAILDRGTEWITNNTQRLRIRSESALSAEQIKDEDIPF